MNKGRFAYKLLSKYPHMKPADVFIWEQFINEKPNFFLSVDYDVHIGEGADFLPTGDTTPDERENRLYQRKIDVVGYSENTTWIIEVKPKADVRALGQILTYRSLVNKEKLFDKSLFFVIVCSEISQEMRQIFVENKIGIYVVKTRQK